MLTACKTPNVGAQATCVAVTNIAVTVSGRSRRHTGIKGPTPYVNKKEVSGGHFAGVWGRGSVETALLRNPNPVSRVGNQPRAGKTSCFLDACHHFRRLGEIALLPQFCCSSNFHDKTLSARLAGYMKHPTSVDAKYSFSGLAFCNYKLNVKRRRCPLPTFS